VRAERNTLAVVALAAVALGLSVAVVYRFGLPSDTGAVIIAVAYTAVALVPLRLPQGDYLFGVAGVMIAAIALQPPAAAVAGAALGSVLTLMILSREQPWRTGLAESLRHPAIAAATVLAVPFLPTPDVSMGLLGAIPWQASFIGLIYLALDLISASVLAGIEHRAGLLASMAGISRLVGPMSLALASVGVALVVLYPAMGLIGGLILVTLMALMKLSFGNYIRARAAYPKTVAVLARLAEIEMQESRGHAERVADLATSVGKGMRLGGRRVERLGLAALLHDIGKVKTGERHDDGAHAHVGAQLLEQIEFLSELAPIVAGHHSMSADKVKNQEDLLAHILYAVSYYDLQVQESTRTEVVLEMRSQSERFDPRVVGALSAAAS
jgi:putative nucleotidyltransferase with HDIG domain